MKRLLAILLSVLFIIGTCAFTASAEVTPFRVNVSRISMGTDPNMGTYFLFDGQEEALANSLYSRGLLAEWDDALGAYKCTGSLGYEGDKTGWDIPATGFALMISCFADGNAFDQANSGAADNFSYKDTAKDNALVGASVYLYNIDLKAGSVKTSGTEGAEDFTSESYVMVGAADSSASAKAYDGKGVSITKAPLPTANNSLYFSHYHATPGLYRDAWGTADTDDIYDQAFIIDPTEYESQEDLEEALDVTAWCFCCVLEAVDLEHRVYKVIHTEGWTDKCDWAYCDAGKEDCWLWNKDGTPNSKRLLLVAMIQNQSEEGKYGCLTYDFGQLNMRAGYYGMANGLGECEPNSGSFLNKYVTFYNVDFKNKLVLTSGDWGTPEFASQSYALFSENMPTEIPELADLSDGKGNGSDTTKPSDSTDPTTTTTGDNGSTTGGDASTDASANETTTTTTAKQQNNNGGNTNTPTTTTASAAPTETGDGTIVAIAIALVAGLAVLVLSAKKKRV